LHKYRKIPSTSDEQEQFYKDLLKHVFTSPQHQALKDLGLIEAKIESLDLRVQDNNSFHIKFVSEIFNSFNDVGKYIEYTVFYNQIYIENGFNDFRQRRVGHKHRKKDKKIFYKIGNGILVGFEKLYDMYLNHIHNSYLGDEIKFINEIPNDKLPLHISNKWQSKYTSQIFLNRLKNCKFIK